MVKNKKGGLISLESIIILLITLLLTYSCWDYYLETKGKNNNAANFCRDLGYEIDNEINFFFKMTCYKINNEIREDYFVKEYDEESESEDKYYLRKV